MQHLIHSTEGINRTHKCYTKFQEWMNDDLGSSQEDNQNVCTC